MFTRAVCILLLALFATCDTCVRYDLALSWMSEMEYHENAAVTWPPVAMKPFGLNASRLFRARQGFGVEAVNVQDGSLIWRFEDDAVVGGCSETGGNRQLACQRRGSVYGLSAYDGTKLGSFQFRDEDEVPSVTGAPFGRGSMIFVGTSAGRVYAVKNTTFELVWVQDLGESNAIGHKFSWWRNKLVVGTYSGAVYILQASNGVVLGSFLTPGVDSYAPGNDTEGITSRIFVSGDIAYYSMNNGAAVALNLLTMSLVWMTTPVPGAYSTMPPYVTRDLIFFVPTSGFVIALSPLSGAKMWVVDLVEDISTNGPLSMLDDNVLIITTTSGSVVGISTSTTEVLFWFGVGSAGDSDSTVRMIGRRAFVSGSSMLYPITVACIKEGTPAPPVVLKTRTPTMEPTKRPTRIPTRRPTSEPTIKPTREPTLSPTRRPTSEPTLRPTTEPTFKPTRVPTSEPTRTPTAEPTIRPTTEPTAKPTREPTVVPTRRPTQEPTSRPTSEPTPRPTRGPTPLPTRRPAA